VELPSTHYAHLDSLANISTNSCLLGFDHIENQLAGGVIWCNISGYLIWKKKSSLGI